MKLNRTETLQFWLNLALKYSSNSNSKRLKVGCVIIRENEIMSYGWNYHPTSNEMEYVEEKFAGNDLEDPIFEVLTTKPEVIHAETNAIGNWVQNGNKDISTSIMFITHSPCLECAKLIYSVGIRHVVYQTQYRDTKGIDFLKELGVNVEQWLE